MHSSASCASCIAGAAKKHSFVATSGTPKRSASEISPGSTARSTGRPCRCSSTASRSPNASRMRPSSAAASGSRPSASNRANGPRVPPVSSISPSARPATTSKSSCGAAGSLVRNPAEDRRCRLASPASFCASSTTGSAPPARVRLIWQPMIGCTPRPTQYCENSSAPNRLAVSVMATAGMPESRARAAIFSGFIAPSLSE